MRTYVGIWLLVLTCSIVNAQSRRYKAKLDTLAPISNSYLEDHDIKTFFALPELQDEIDFLNIDQNLLDACVFFQINASRKKMGRKDLTINHKLYEASKAYTSVYNKNSFNGDSKDLLKAKKTIKYASKKEKVDCGQLTSIVSICRLMDIKRFERFHYDKVAVTDGESSYGLYKGDRKLKYDTTKVREEIEPMTYIEFANSIVKSFVKQNRRIVRTKSYTEGACSVMFDSKTLFKNRIPSVKLIFVFAGKRTNLIPEKELDYSIY